MGYDWNDWSDQNDQTLDSCPFCGSEADVRVYDPPFVSLRHGLRYYYVTCIHCGAMTNPVATTVEEAISQWNRRATSLPYDTEDED